MRVQERRVAMHVDRKGTSRVMMMRHSHGRGRTHTHALMHLKVRMRVGGHKRGLGEGGILLSMRLDGAAESVLARHHSLTIGGERVGREATIVTVRDGNGVGIGRTKTAVHVASHAASTVELCRSAIVDA